MRLALTVLTAGALALAGCSDQAAPDTQQDGEPSEDEPVNSGVEGKQGLDLPHTDISPDQFRVRWNEAIAAYGYGPALGPLEQNDREQLGLLIDEQESGEWLRIQVSTHPKGVVTQSRVEASPRNADQFSRALAGAAAMISASSSLGPAEAEQLVTDTVAPAESMTQGEQLLEDVERDGVRYRFTVTPQNPAGEIVAFLSVAMIPIGD